MGFLRVIDPGLLSTVQDLGRPGFAHMGIPIGGAADPLSLRIGNRLVGNPPNAAAIEMTLTGGRFEFEHEVVAALAGAQASARIRESSGNSREVECMVPMRVRPGEHLIAGRANDGARTYLCIAGGVSVPPILGSASTHIGAGIGGFGGRALRKEDRVEFGEPTGPHITRELSVMSAQIAHAVGQHGSLRAVQRHHATFLDPSLLAAFWESKFQVASNSNRVGIRLEGGPALQAGPPAGRMTTEGMIWGAVQLPPDGNPIILMCDHPTTGGYPVIACVASADLPVLGQVRPGDTIGFEQVSRSEALGLQVRRETVLAPLLRNPSHPIRSGRISTGYQDQVRQRASATASALRNGKPRIPTIDLNADLGESSDPERLELDRKLLKIVTSANIACGGHAGDKHTMSEIVAAALANGVSLGAHPSYPDRPNFGRVAMNLTEEEVEQTVRDQLAALEAITSASSRYLKHVKPHGALYHAANTSPGIAAAIGRAAAECGETIILVGQARSLALEVWKSLGLAVAAEAFADRRYEPDGTLRPRTCPDALITDPAEAAAQAVEIVLHHCVRAVDGRDIALFADTTCIHSDTPNALAVARAVRAALELAGVAVTALGASKP